MNSGANTTVLTLPAAAAALLVLIVSASAAPAFAEVPSCIKNNAAWWSQDQISEAEFLAGISYLISIGTITIPPDAAAGDDGADSEPVGAREGVPPWVKNNAAWWAEDLISDDDFLNGIQYLVGAGLITVPSPADEADTDGLPETEDAVLAELEAQLAECSELAKAYQRID